jgi:6-phosphogluconolactonase
LQEEGQLIKHEGSSINKSRQQSPHVHSTVLSPDNKYLMTPDLGTDKVYIYNFDRTNTANPLTPSVPAFVNVKAGSGPRHLVFHPNKKFAYLIHEMEGMITVFDYKNGKLTEKQTITMLPAGFSGRIGAADIHISPDGRFLYGSNRDDANEIVIYSIKKDGTLTYTGRQSTLGKSPRNFVIDPTGNFLLVANQNSDNILIFRRDKKTGLLTPLDKNIQIGAPVCLKFVSE